MKIKKTVSFCVLLCVLCAAVFAQNTIYVSAKGNDNNNGLSEARPVKTLTGAYIKVNSSINKITIIGTLTQETGLDDTCFGIVDSNGVLGNREFLITGKSGASGAERAVLSGKGSGKGVLAVGNTKIRFEHIEISGGEGEEFGGIYIAGNSQVTLGTGAVVRDNAVSGIFTGSGASCVIDGGEVSNTTGPGVFVATDGVLTLQNGAIKDNRTENAGGVIINAGGRFTMSGGTITGNRVTGSGGGILVFEGGRFDQTGGTITGNSAVEVGGGVLVWTGGRFDQTGGTVSGNTAGQGPNIFRLPGALGSNL